MTLSSVQESIAAAVGEYRRRDADITLVAVSKQQPEDRVRQALKDGQRVFGENRVQEAASRWTGLRREYPDIRLHLIGHLQTNKAADAVALFDVIETVDSEKLALALAAEMTRQNRHLPCFIQVNTGEEEQKGGVAPAGLPALLQAAKTAGLDIQGLMCIPPADDVPDVHFALLHKLAKAHDLECLSMGMSGDFQTAIAYGATHLRIGSAIFGDRD